MEKQGQVAILVKEKRLRLTSLTAPPKPLYGQPPWEGHSACAERKPRTSLRLRTRKPAKGGGRKAGSLEGKERVGRGRDGVMTHDAIAGGAWRGARRWTLGGSSARFVGRSVCILQLGGGECLAWVAAAAGRTQ